MDTRVWIDICIVAAGCVVGNVVFRRFARGVPLYRRVAKYVVLFTALTLIGVFLGRIAFWSVIGLMTIGLAVVHAWWLPRNGVNGITAEPYDRYLELTRGARPTLSRRPRQAPPPAASQ